MPAPTQASLFGAILKEEPLPLSSILPLTPPTLDRVVRKCLAKEPERRWQSASDLTDALKWIVEGSLQNRAQTAVATRRGRHERLAWCVAGVCVLALAVALPLILAYLHGRFLIHVDVDEERHRRLPSSSTGICC